MTTATTLPVQRVIRKHQGDTWDSFAVIWKQNTTPVDLTGYTAALVISQVRGGDVVLELTSEAGDLTIVADEGRIEMSVPFAKTDITPGRYYYDLVVTNGTVKKTLVYGNFIISANSE